MAESVPITALGPRLEPVLGPLPADEERDLRARLLAAGQVLLGLAQRIGGRVGWHNQGLELEWMPSGQLSITSYVATLDPDKNAVTFSVQLRPGWYFGEAHDPPSWVIETSVEADCLHSVDHQAMETVYQQEITTHSPRDAVMTLVQEVQRLVGTATEHPVDHWTDMTRD